MLRVAPEMDYGVGMVMRNLMMVWWWFGMEDMLVMILVQDDGWFLILELMMSMLGQVG